MERRDLVDKRNMQPGDRILLTKGVAVEGTAIIAQAFADRLSALGMAAGELAASRALEQQISILPEAAVARETPGVTAMHDVTEGGVATALSELSCAGRHRLEIVLDRIPILPQCARIGKLLGIDPLGLIGSGSLLVACRPDAAAKLLERLARKGIAAACIGEVRQPGRGIEAYRNGTSVPWPEFTVDELTRLF
jgi:hydrogenase maturation factor